MFVAQMTVDLWWLIAVLIVVLLAILILRALRR